MLQLYQNFEPKNRKMPPPSTGSTRRRHRMRCSHRKCRTTFTLKRHPDQYKRPPRCPCCKSLCVHSIEGQRRRALAKQDTCRCAAYPFPHRAGSLRMCVAHPLFHVEPTVEEIHAYESLMQTPRSGWC